MLAILSITLPVILSFMPCRAKTSGCPSDNVLGAVLIILLIVVFIGGFIGYMLFRFGRGALLDRIMFPRWFFRRRDGKN